LLAGKGPPPLRRSNTYRVIEARERGRERELGPESGVNGALGVPSEVERLPS